MRNCDSFAEVEISENAGEENSIKKRRRQRSSSGCCFSVSSASFFHLCRLEEEKKHTAFLLPFGAPRSETALPSLPLHSAVLTLVRSASSSLLQQLEDSNSQRADAMCSSDISFLCLIQERRKKAAQKKGFAACREKRKQTVSSVSSNDKDQASCCTQQLSSSKASSRTYTSYSTFLQWSSSLESSNSCCVSDAFSTTRERQTKELQIDSEKKEPPDCPHLLQALLLPSLLNSKQQQQQQKQQQQQQQNCRLQFALRLHSAAVRCLRISSFLSLFVSFAYSQSHLLFRLLLLCR